MRGKTQSLLILGLGNMLCGDDGLGVAALAELDLRYEIPPNVQLVDAGTLSPSLLPYLSQAQALIIVDAIRADCSPGSPVRLTGDDVPPAIESRLPVHQIGVADLLDVQSHMGSKRPRVVLLGLVPETQRLGPGRSPAVIRALPGLVGAIAREALELGFELVPREADETFPGDSPLTPRPLRP